MLVIVPQAACHAACPGAHWAVIRGVIVKNFPVVKDLLRSSVGHSDTTGKFYRKTCNTCGARDAWGVCSVGQALAGASRSNPAEAKAPQARECLGELLVRGARADVDAAAIAAGVAAQEAHLGAGPAQAHHRVADPGVVDVALAVDEEEVGPEAVARRTRLDRSQVDPADGELGEDLHQRAGVVFLEESRQRGPVGPGRGRELAGRDDDEDRVTAVDRSGTAGTRTFRSYLAAAKAPARAASRCPWAACRAAPAVDARGTHS